VFEFPCQLEPVLHVACSWPLLACILPKLTYVYLIEVFCFGRIVSSSQRLSYGKLEFRACIL